jgi:hypothetical protein
MQVVYSADSPNRVRVSSFSGLWGPSAALIFGGWMMLLFGVLVWSGL